MQVSSSGSEDSGGKAIIPSRSQESIIVDLNQSSAPALPDHQREAASLFRKKQKWNPQLQRQKSEKLKSLSSFRSNNSVILSQLEIIDS